MLQEMRVSQAEMRIQQAEIRQHQAQMMSSHQDLLKDHESRIRGIEKLLEQSTAILTSMNAFVKNQSVINEKVDSRMARIERSFYIALGVFIALKFGAEFLSKFIAG